MTFLKNKQAYNKAVLLHDFEWRKNPKSNKKYVSSHILTILSRIVKICVKFHGPKLNPRGLNHFTSNIDQNPRTICVVNIDKDFLRWRKIQINVCSFNGISKTSSSVIYIYFSWNSAKMSKKRHFKFRHH